MSGGDPFMRRAMRKAQDYLRLRWILRGRCYKAVFFAGGSLSRDAEIVLADLRKFCRLNETTFHVDPCEAARLQGRREAGLRIVQHLNLDEEQVQKLVEIDDGLGDD